MDLGAAVVEGLQFLRFGIGLPYGLREKHYRWAVEILDRLDHFGLLFLRQLIVEGQPQQPVRDVLAYRTITHFAAKLPSKGG